MHHVRQENLPFVGSSHEFVGAEQGDTSVSVFLFHGKSGSGPGPHRHPYDEIQFIREGRGAWTVNGKTFEGSAGDNRGSSHYSVRFGWPLLSSSQIRAAPERRARKRFKCHRTFRRAGYSPNRARSLRDLIAAVNRARSLVPKT